MMPSGFCDRTDLIGKRQRLPKISKALFPLKLHHPFNFDPRPVWNLTMQYHHFFIGGGR